MYQTNQKSYRQISIFQNISKQNSTIYIKITDHDQAAYTEGIQYSKINIQQSINVIYHNDRLKKTKHIIRSIATAKEF